MITTSRNVDWKPTASERGENGDEGEQKPLVTREGGRASRKEASLALLKHPENSHPLHIYRCFCTNGATMHNSAPVMIPCQYLPHLHMLRAGLVLHLTPLPSPDGYSGCPWVSLPHTRLLPTSSSHTTLNTWGGFSETWFPRVEDLFRVRKPFSSIHYYGTFLPCCLFFF